VGVEAGSGSQVGGEAVMQSEHGPPLSQGGESCFCGVQVAGWNRPLCASVLWVRLYFWAVSEGLCKCRGLDRPGWNARNGHH
jgi:hypothetical protein